MVEKSAGSSFWISFLWDQESGNLSNDNLYINARKRRTIDSLILRCEFIKENKKVRKKERKHAFDQES